LYVRVNHGVADLRECFRPIRVVCFKTVNFLSTHSTL